MNVLILHHFSDYWHHGLKNCGTTFEDEMIKVMDYILNSDINKIILPLFEQYQVEDCHDKLVELCSNKSIQLEVHEYNYAWSKEGDHNGDIYTEENFNKTWCYGTRDHHGDEDVVEIERWQHNLKQAKKVIVAGAFENECVLDLTTALDAIEIDYVREESLIVGTGVVYEFIGQNQEDIQEELHNKFQEIEEKVIEKMERINEIFPDNIVDLEELHEYESDFVMNIEDEMNEIFNDYDEKIRIFSLYPPSLEYIEPILDNFFDYLEESDQFQSEHNNNFTNQITKKIFELSEEFEDYEEFKDINDFVKEKEEDVLKNIFSKIKKIYTEAESSGDSDFKDYDIEETTQIEVFKEIWKDYLMNNEELSLDTMDFLASKEKEVNNIKNKKAIKLSK
jgi:hypothetical protein